MIAAFRLPLFKMGQPQKISFGRNADATSIVIGLSGVEAMGPAAAENFEENPLMGPMLIHAPRDLRARTR